MGPSIYIINNLEYLDLALSDTVHNNHNRSTRIHSYNNNSVYNLNVELGNLSLDRLMMLREWTYGYGILENWNI